jgi:hypothetical protein
LSVFDPAHRRGSLMLCNGLAAIYFEPRDTSDAGSRKNPF